MIELVVCSIFTKPEFYLITMSIRIKVKSLYHLKFLADVSMCQCREYSLKSLDGYFGFCPMRITDRQQ